VNRGRRETRERRKEKKRGYLKARAVRKNRSHFLARLNRAGALDLPASAKMSRKKSTPGRIWPGCMRGVSSSETGNQPAGGKRLELKEKVSVKGH